MMKTALAAVILLGALAVPSHAGRSGGRLDAITTGRVYDRVLTPTLNPRFWMTDRNAQKAFERDLKRGRVKVDPQRVEQADWLLGLFKRQ